jgi:Transglutaminase-like superfamily
MTEAEGVLMSLLVLRAYLRLIEFDYCLLREDFGALYDKVRNYPLGRQGKSPAIVDEVCAAVDMACIWYWKPISCLQRSAATACLLKGRGVPAQMVIGAQLMPFRSHAWIEVDGRVVNDKPYAPEMYAVLARC